MTETDEEIHYCDGCRFACQASDCECICHDERWQKGYEFGAKNARQAERHKWTSGVGLKTNVELEEQRDFLLRLLGKARAKLPLDSAIRKEIGNYLEHKKAKHVHKFVRKWICACGVLK